MNKYLNFNPRSPHGERRFYLLLVGVERLLFQPTLPARGATQGIYFSQLARKISTHAPRTGSDILAEMEKAKEDISTHAPRTGSDRKRQRRKATMSNISTHAPRTGSDKAPDKVYK